MGEEKLLKALEMSLENKETEAHDPWRQEGDLLPFLGKQAC